MPCTEDGRITRLESQVTAVGKTLDRLDSKMDQVLTAINRVEVLETKHANSNEALSRAFTKIEVVERDHSETRSELHENLNKLRGMKYLAWVLWTVMASAVGALVLDRMAN
jgi:multidrug resistance efflux pump